MLTDMSRVQPVQSENDTADEEDDDDDDELTLSVGSKMVMLEREVGEDEALESVVVSSVVIVVVGIIADVESAVGAAVVVIDVELGNNGVADGGASCNSGASITSISQSTHAKKYISGISTTASIS